MRHWSYRRTRAALLAAEEFLQRDSWYEQYPKKLLRSVAREIFFEPKEPHAFLFGAVIFGVYLTASRMITFLPGADSWPSWPVTLTAAVLSILAWQFFVATALKTKIAASNWMVWCEFLIFLLCLALWPGLLLYLVGAGVWFFLPLIRPIDISGLAMLVGEALVAFFYLAEWFGSPH